MIEFSGKSILLDVEGTTSSVAYVYDVLFPYAREHTKSYLENHWKEPATVNACNLIAKDAGLTNFLEPDKVCTEVYRLMDSDIKATGLKELQGLIWKEGYKSGQLKSHIFADVPIALERWHSAGLDVRIYSSGSVTAQKVFFANTKYGDLGKFLQGHYDTTTGPKRSANSYSAIAHDSNLEPHQLLFLSDIIEELDAANAAGMMTVLVVRPGNAPVSDNHGHAVISEFGEISVPVTLKREDG